METRVKEIDKITNEFYDKLVEMYGEYYEKIDIEIKMSEKNSHIIININPDIRNKDERYKDIRENYLYKKIEGPKVENSGAMWDKSGSEKIHS